jgi:hypothetical protein
MNQKRFTRVRIERREKDEHSTSPKMNGKKSLATPDGYLFLYTFVRIGILFEPEFADRAEVDTKHKSAFL